MTNRFKSLVCAAALASAGFVAPAAFAATLAGQNVSVNFHSQDTLGNITDGPVSTIAAPGSVAFGSFLTAIYTDQQITITNLVPSSSVSFFDYDFFTGAPFVFNGVHFEVGAPTFFSVAIDPASTVAGAGAYFNSLNLWVGLAGLSFNTGDTVILDLNGYVPPPPAPEPATWVMLLAGFGASGAALRRRRPAVVSG